MTERAQGRAAYRVREVADQLGLGESSVYRLINSGALACYRLAGNTIRVGVHHLDAYLERAECPARELTEAGPSNDEPAASPGRLTDEPPAVPSGYRSALRTKTRLDARSQTLRPSLSVVKP